jgi:hypothetical protein
MLTIASAMVGTAAFSLGYDKVAIIMPVVGMLLFLKGLFALDSASPVFVKR